MTLVVSLAVVLALSLSSLALATPLRSLIATPSAIPGFATATVKVRSTRSARVYAMKVLEARPQKAAKEVATLKRHGFRGAVQELLKGTQGEALSLAIVFENAKQARREFTRSKVADVKDQGKSEVTALSIPAIPGAFAFAAREAGARGAAANVLFTVGHCFILVGDYLRDATAEQAGVVPTQGGPAVYRQDVRRCA